MKTLSSSNKTRLKQYTAVAGALVAQGNLQAQVVATDLNPDIVVDSLSAPFALDFNNDANPEMNFFVQNLSGASSTQGVQFTYEGALAGIALSPGVSVMGAAGTGSSSSSFQISALNNGDQISAAGNFSSSAAVLGLDILVDAGLLGQIPIQQGNFRDQSNKFLGAKLTAGANTYYGWVELSVNTNASQITIHGFGYQSTANSQILAGEGANSGLELISLSDKVTIVGTPEHVNINVTPDVIGSTVSFVSLSGQTLKSEKLTDINNTISFDQLSTGIYQVVVSTDTEKTTHRVYVK
jgi:hypothetical protein